VRRWVAIGSGLAVAVSLAACGGGSTTISTRGGKITVNRNGNSVQFSTPGASGSVAAGGQSVAVPNGFPSAVPRPAGGRLAYAVTTQGSTGGNFDLIYRYSSASTASTALSSYDAALRSAGFTELGSSSEAHTVLQGWRSAAWSLSITVGPTGSTPASELSITVSPAS
jgi:hypothetical protein